MISEVDENYVPLRNKANDYLIDRKLQKTKSYTGIKGVSEQDAAVQDSQGPIADRTREHLGPTDLGIMHFRKLVMECARALQQGQPPAHLAHQDRYAVRSGACVTHKAKDLSAVMVERFGDENGFVGRPGGTRRRSRRASVVIASEAKQSMARQAEGWIASSLTLLAMTAQCIRARFAIPLPTAAPAIFAVGEAGFLQIEIAFDPPPGLVGDLAVAQQHVDEFALRRDQFPRQVDARRRDIVGLGIERIRQLVDAGLVPRAQQLDHFVGQFAVVGDGVERLQRRAERFAPRRDFRLVLRHMFVAAGLGDAEPAHHRRQPEPEPDQGDEDDAEAEEQDQVAVGKAFAVRQRERQRQRRGQRNRAAHAGEGEDETHCHGGDGSRSRRRLLNIRGK